MASFGGRPLVRQTLPREVRYQGSNISNEQRKPIIPGKWIYVATTYIGPDDPGNDPPGATFNSPLWMNNFTNVAGFPVAFRHGVDGQTDMIGMYDLVTNSPVSGDTAFMMPYAYAQELPPSHAFPVELATDVWSMAVQTCVLADQVAGDVPIRIFWPIVATPYP